MSYEVSTNQNMNTWSRHRTEKGALKGYREACQDGQKDIQIFKDGQEVFVFNTYDNGMGYKGLIITENQEIN